MSSSHEEVLYEHLTLPEGYEYSNVLKIGTSEYHFSCKDLKTADEIKNWVRLFGEKTQVAWRVSTTYPHRQPFKIQFRCQHGSSSYKSKESSIRKCKSTKCPAKLKISQVPSDDDAITKFVLHSDHNHELATIPSSTKHIINNSSSLSSDLLYEHLILPEGYDYSNFVKIGMTEYHFSCEGLKTADEIKTWVKLFGEMTFVEWRIATTYPHRQPYKIHYRCQHSSSRYKLKESSNRKSKSTQCSAQLKIEHRLLPDNDNIITRIILNSDHNHALGTNTASLKYRDVSESAKEMLRQLFYEGHSPTSAHQTIECDAFVEYGFKYQVAADRKHIPDLMYCYSFFYKQFKKKSRAVHNCDLPDFVMLSNKLQDWCNKCGAKAAIDFFSDDIILCIMTPLMQRVHKKIFESGEVIFLEGSPHSHRPKHRMYLLYVRSVAGGLPLGYIITSSAKQDTLEAALRQFCLLDTQNTCFFARGTSTGPQNIIIDDDLIKRKSIEKIWPNSNVFLCPIYVSRTVLQWLSDAKHGIDKTDQETLFFAFRKILTACSCKTAVESFAELHYSETGSKYPEFCEYVEIVWWPIKESWCACYRQNLPPSETHINSNYALRALKDIVLQHLKTHNIAQLVDFVTTRFDKYYSLRIADFVKNRFSSNPLKKFLPDAEDVFFEAIVPKEHGSFTIRDAQEDCIIDINLGFCTCHAGIRGIVCKHQSAVLLCHGKDSCSPPNAFAMTIHASLIDVASNENLPLSSFKDLDEPIAIKEDSMQFLVVNTTDGEVILCKEADDNANVPAVLQHNNTSEEFSQEDDTQFLDAEATETCSQALMNIKLVLLDIAQRLEQNSTPEIVQAATLFCRNYKVLCQEDSSLLAALSTFGEASEHQHHISTTESINFHDYSQLSPSRKRQCYGTDDICEENL